MQLPNLSWTEVFVAVIRCRETDGCWFAASVTRTRPMRSPYPRSLYHPVHQLATRRRLHDSSQRGIVHRMGPQAV
jgi:hypothetical protein